MTRINLSLLFFLLLFQVVYSNTKDVESNVSEVTVFLNGAQVTRTFSAPVKKGLQTLKVTDLSPYLDAKTIQLQGNGEFTILSIRHQINYLDEKEVEGELKVLTDSLNLYQKRYTSISIEINALSESEAFLKSNNRIKGNNENLDVATFKGLHDFYFNELFRIQKRRNELSYEQVEINKTITKFRNQLNEINKRLTSSDSEVLVEIKSEKMTKGEFELSYLVNHASWYPSYDIRVQDINNPLALTYKANVQQRTGEDWNNVKLTFSNANPYQSGNLPILKPYYLGYSNSGYNPNPYRANQTQNSYNLNNYIGTTSNEARGRVVDAQGNPVPFATVRVQGTAIGTYTDEDGNFSITLPQGKAQVNVQSVGYTTRIQNLSPTAMNSIVLQPNQAQLNSVVVTAYDKSSVKSLATYDAVSATTEGRSYSWSFGNRQKYKSETITVTPLENQTTLELTLDVPFTIESGGKKKVISISTNEIPAYYEYRSVPKLEEAAFLIARIEDWSAYNLLEGEANLYFEKTYVGKSILDVRYLTDTLNISLGRDKSVLVNRQKVKSQTTREFIGKETIEKRQFEIKVRNNKSQAINLIVYDQIPISRQPKDIEVTLKDKKGATYTEKTGELKWEFDLKQDKTEELGFRYEVKFPKDRTINLE
jgi:uncharacterized protein (TIGR02231 family)